jgi:hypothetical protein
LLQKSKIYQKFNPNQIASCSNDLPFFSAGRGFGGGYDLTFPCG